MLLYGAYTYSQNYLVTTAYNLNSVAILAAALAFIAFGQMVVIFTAGIDLSVGPLAGLLVVIASFFAVEGKSTGMVILDHPSPVFDHAELGPAVGVPDAALRQVNLACGDSIVELLEYTNPPEADPTPVRADRRGAAHLALLVDDAEAAKAELEGRGVEFLGGVNAVDDGVLAGWRWVYFRDPFGIVLELVEVAYRDAEAAAQSIDKYRAARA